MLKFTFVTLLVSAWIEISRFAFHVCVVALLVSAWIEIAPLLQRPLADPVALLVSAWIEIHPHLYPSDQADGRTPRECVD